MKTIHQLSIGMLMLCSFAACKRDDNKMTAGKGGSAVLNCMPAHHNVYTNIINAKIFLKYNAQDASDNFDDSANCSLINGKPTAIFTGLKKGNYYILGTGYDTSISQSVRGGISYTIVSETSIDLNVPVTETH